MRTLFVFSCVVSVVLVACGGKSLKLDDGSGGGSDGTGGSAGTTFVPEQSNAYALAVDDEHVYWVTGYPNSAQNPQPTNAKAFVRGCIKSNCARTVTNYDSWPNPQLEYSAWARFPFSALAVWAGKVYWSRVTPSNQYEVVSCPSTGCAGEPTLLITASEVDALVSDGKALYWSSSVGRAISTCALDHCDHAETFTKTQSYRPKGMAVDSTFVYWLDEDPDGGWAALRAPKADGTKSEKLASKLNQPASLSLSSRYVSFTSYYAVGDVAYCPLRGCVNTPTRIATNQTYPLTIASDESHIFWLNVPPSGSIKSASVMQGDFDGTEPIEIGMLQTSDVTSERALVVDEDFVYWISWGAQDETQDFPHAGIHRRAK